MFASHGAWPWLLAGSVLAQDPEPAVLRAKLAAPEAATVAWGAYDAGRLDCRLLVPELRATLVRLAAVEPAAQGTREHHAVVAAVLDALIRTGASLPASELLPWLSRRPSEAIVLASRAPEQQAGLLLRVVESSRTQGHWIAACNLLLLASPDVLVPHLLTLAEVHLAIEVTSPDCFFSSHSATVGCGCGSGQRLAGFPPVVWYELHLGRSTTCFADGPQPVSYARCERTQATFGLGGCTTPVDRADYALRCLYRLAAREKPAHRLESRRQESVEWAGADALRAAVGTLEHDLAAEWSTLLGDLRGKGYVSPEVAGRTTLRIVREITDRRDEADRKEPLPELAAPLAAPIERTPPTPAPHSPRR